MIRRAVIRRGINVDYIPNTLDLTVRHHPSSQKDDIARGNVFQGKAYASSPLTPALWTTLEQVQDATKSNWKDNEPMRQHFLNQEKYGNDIDSVDALYVRVADSLSDILGTLYNQKGQEFRRPILLNVLACLKTYQFTRV